MKKPLLSCLVSLSLIGCAQAPLIVPSKSVQQPATPVELKSYDDSKSKSFSTTGNALQSKVQDFLTRLQSWSEAVKASLANSPR